MQIEFLNVDLEIESSQDMQPIIDDFGEDVLVLHHGKNASGHNFVSFEVNSLAEKDADGIISLFCVLIENLSDEARLIWDKCHLKRFDAGFQSGEFPRSYQTEIRTDTINQIKKIGASIGITIYPMNN